MAHPDNIIMKFQGNKSNTHMQSFQLEDLQRWKKKTKTNRENDKAGKESSEE